MSTCSIAGTQPPHVVKTVCVLCVRQVSVSNPMLLLVVNASSTSSDDGGGAVLSIVIIVVVVVLGLGLILASYMALSTLKRWHNAEVGQDRCRMSEFDTAHSTTGG